MKRGIDVLIALFAPIVLIIAGCGGVRTTPTTPLLMKALTETPSLVSPITTSEVGGAQPVIKQVSDKDGMTYIAQVPARELTSGLMTNRSRASCRGALSGSIRLK